MQDFQPYQEIEIMADELATVDRVEHAIRSEQGKMQQTVDRFALRASLYSNPARMEALIAELRGEVQAYMQAAGNRGKLLSRSQLSRFLERSERRDLAQKQLNAIARANSRRAKRRLNLAFMELEKEAGILKADIAIFKERARQAGFSNKDILRQLVMANQDKRGVVQGFAKRAQRVAVNAMRREQSSSKIAERRLLAKPNELWVWVTVSVRPCPDCTPRAGVALPLARWEAKGLPGSGRTVCGAACRCDLVPQSIGDDMYPEVKSFTWDANKTVLATKGDLRTFGAKTHKSRLAK